jgi:hypothetical protein
MFCLVSTALAQQPTIPKSHPRLLGSTADLKALAQQRPQEFQRMVAIAKARSADNHSLGLSMALVAVINDDRDLATAAHQLAMKLVNGPIRKGHVTFGSDLALAGLIYDLCYDTWPEPDRAKFHDYFNKTVDANVDSETHVFHNAWYSYKNWGIGIAALATYHENPRSPKIFESVDHDYKTRAAPALELAGAGGGWAEGYYIHYWSYEWLFFCEVARRCAGLDYYDEAPAFYKNRALASAFETYPGLSEYNSRRPVPMGDGGGRMFGGDRDKQLAARRILVSHYRNDPLHQAIHTFNEQTPRVATGNNAYKDFLWRDTTIRKGDLKSLPLSHFSPGPGYVYARSSWDADATYFFFKAGDRFTAHQHLDNGHFLIYRGDELAGDGGHYESFGSEHDVNYQARTIAHSTMLILDPAEKWPAIRGGKVTGNDGGQHHNWPHHNGASSDPQEWERNRRLYDIADTLAFEDRGDYLYTAADLTRAYSSNKLARFIRQVVYLRPGTFVIFDQVTATQPDFQKTWLLQAMKPPIQQNNKLVITNGNGKLFVQTLLPDSPKLNIATSADLYSYGGQTYPPDRNTGPAPEARIGISPSTAAATDLFLHVLTATESKVETLAPSTLRREGDRLIAKINDAQITFSAIKPGGEIQINAQRRPFGNTPPERSFAPIE